MNNNHIVIGLFSLMLFCFLFTSCLVCKNRSYQFSNEVDNKITNYIQEEISGTSKIPFIILKEESFGAIVNVSYYDELSEKISDSVKRTNLFFKLNNLDIPILYYCDSYSKQKHYIPIGGYIIKIDLNGNFIEDGHAF